MKVIKLVMIVIACTSVHVFAQKEPGKPGDYRNLQWKTVATKMPTEWYASNEAKLVAENVLLYQKDIGGWDKNKDYHLPISESEKTKVLKRKLEPSATFDNGATITELKFLAKVYSNFKDNRYKEAFEKGLHYIFESQYENGGWPQFYPIRGSESVSYSGHITYNDNAMVNVMDLLQGILLDDEAYTTLQLSSDIKSKSKKAFDNGVQCILKTQIIIKGQPTVWCAQHDEKTFLPAKARKFELESFSGGESVGITLLLMSIKNPSNDIITAVDGAAKWFEANKIEGIRLGSEIDKDGKKNIIVIEDKEAPPIWARFYDLETSKPFFCDRDGVKRNSLSDIGFERRNGYSWYTQDPAKVLKRYAFWKIKLTEK